MDSKLQIDSTGWLRSVEVVPSPNFNARPDNESIRLIVVHGISLPPGEFGGGYIQQFFLNNLECDFHPYFEKISDMQVSAHCLIERTGNIVQFVSFKDRAWHAGVSEWQGCHGCNDFSVGIEMEGTDEIAYTDLQYAALNQLNRCLRNTYAIKTDAICGHSDIAPGRKTDPGNSFDWSKVN